MKQELKATKLDVLRFIQSSGVIDTMDLVNRFGYSYSGARVRLHRLEKTKLVEELGIRPGAFCLTNEAERRLEYHAERH